MPIIEAFLDYDNARKLNHEISSKKSPDVLPVACSGTAGKG
jgi:hypothetical protein